MSSTLEKNGGFGWYYCYYYYYYYNNNLLQQPTATTCCNYCNYYKYYNTTTTPEQPARPRGSGTGIPGGGGFGLGQMRPHARAGSELAPRGCFLWYKEAHHKAPVHVRTRHARLMASSAKAGHLSETFAIKFFSRTCGPERRKQACKIIEITRVVDPRENGGFGWY